MHFGKGFKGVGLYPHYLLACGILQDALDTSPVHGEEWSLHKIPSWDCSTYSTSQQQASHNDNGIEDERKGCHHDFMRGDSTSTSHIIF
jgi:hypothetical protein